MFDRGVFGGSEVVNRRVFTERGGRVRTHAVVAATVLCSVVAGCAAPSDETEETASGDGALQQGELEAQRLLDNVASKDPDNTGVDFWRVSVVTAKGKNEPYVVASGYRGKKDVLDIVLEDGGAQLRGEGEVKVTKEFRAAIAADMGELGRALDERAPAKPSTSSVAPLAYADKCDGARWSYRAAVAAKVIGIGSAVVACGGIIFSLGGSTPVCIGSANVAVLATVNASNAKAALEYCLAAPEN